MPQLFAAVADDDTGATDLAGMLADQGLRALLLIEQPHEDALKTYAREFDAVILATGTRALAPGEAYRKTRSAVVLLRTLNPRVLQIKYCSTFDSSPEGNIGPSIDAALDELGETFTAALPALPVNGRTTYMGYHFVYDKLLSDSPMRRHPLTPMSNPNLVSHLQSQTRRPVGLAPVTVVRAGVTVLRDHLNTLRNGGVGIAILDCTNDAELATIGEAIAGMPVITGSSAPAMCLPRVWQQRGWFHRAGAQFTALASNPNGTLIVAGSCSVATQAQNEWFEAQGLPSFAFDAVQVATGTVPDEVGAVAANIRSGTSCLLRLASTRGDVACVHAWAAEQGISPTEIGRKIAANFACLVKRVVSAAEPNGVIVAGAETSGAVCRTLDIQAFEVGRNIEPGVPLCVARGEWNLPVVLKSGNFGGVDFYGNAIAAIREVYSKGGNR